MDKKRLAKTWFRELGQTGIEVSALGLGTVKFGRNQGVKYPDRFEIPDEAFLRALLDHAKMLGINTLDTAPAYGVSEARLGILLADDRQDWVIVGKAGEEFENGESHYVFTPDHFKMSLERSLKRLNTSYIDILLIHSNGDDLDILSNYELIKTMEDFKAEKMVRAIGASTKTVAGGIRALELMDVAMVTYNPAYMDEKPILDYAAEHQKGIFLKKALASGHINKFNNPDPVQTALNFSLLHPAVDNIIIGTITPAHLENNVKTTKQILQELS